MPPHAPLAAVLVLAACDGGAPAPDALVGTWAAVASHSGTLVVSRVDQDLLDRSRPAVAPLRTEGAEALALPFVLADPAAAGGARRLGTDPPGPCAACAELRLTDAAVVLATPERTYRTDRPAVVTPRTTGFTVFPVALTADDGAAVEVGGTVAFPTVRLRADVPAVLPAPVARRPEGPGDVRVTFAGDGTVTFRTAGAPARTATWAPDGDGRLALTLDGERLPATYALDGDRLTLFLADGPVEERVHGPLEASFRARPGSIVASSPGQELVLTRAAAE